MKRLLIIILLMMGVSGYAEDSYLYWMLSDDMASSAGSWDTLKISYNGSSYLNIYNGDGENAGFYGESVTSTEYSELVSWYGSDPVAFYAGLNSLSLDNADTFVLELYSSEVLVARSDFAQYSAIKGYVTGDPTIVPSVTPYAFAPAAVPEPTSGLLVLVGGALLALRRKRKLIA